MYGRRHVRRSALETGAHAPPELAMRLHARPVELCPRGQDDVPLDTPPHEMEGVAVEPHVRTRPRDRVTPPCGIVGDRAPLGHLAHVGISLEKTQRGLLSGRPNGRNRERRGHDRPSDEARGATHAPVLPNPPPPRALGGSSATSSSSTTSTR